MMVGRWQTSAQTCPTRTSRATLRASRSCWLPLSASEEPRLNSLTDAVVAVRVAGGMRPLPILIGGIIAYQPGVKERTGADGVALDLAQALAFARKHRPAAS